MTFAAWVRLIAVQLVQLAATVLGLFILAPACIAQAWEYGGTSIKDKRGIDSWRWPLNAVYGNPEDGVSGQYARIWSDGMPRTLARYMPGAGPRWRAYCWSALRNSCNQLKYRFAWAAGPLCTRLVSIFGLKLQLKYGWQPENGYNVPVISISKV